MTETLTLPRDLLLGYPPIEIAVQGVKRPVIYARISVDRTGAGIKVAHQVADCRTMGTALDLPSADVLSDNDMSAYSGKPRPGFDELIAGLESGRWNVLLVWHSDRLYRNLEDLARLVRVVQANNVEVHTHMGGKLDLSTAEGQMMAGFLGVFAVWESAHRSDRVKNGARGTVHRALNGKNHGGTRRYGFPCMCPGAHEIVKYDSDGNVVVSWHRHLDDAQIQAERDVVKWLTQETIKGARSGALAKKLRDDGVPSPRGGTWICTTVKELVTRPANAGLVISTAGQRKDKRVARIVRDDDGTLVAGQWDAIVTVEEWETATVILRDPSRGTYHGRVTVSLLAGIGTCHCGQAVLSGGSSGKYVSRCGHLKRSRGPVDDLVHRVVAGVLERKGVQAVDGTVLGIDNTDRIAVLSAQLQRLEDRLADEDIDLDGYRRQRARKLEQITALSDQQQVSHAPGVLVGVTAETFPTLPLELQRAVVSSLLTVTFRETGRRGRVFDPESVEILPRAA